MYVYKDVETPTVIETTHGKYSARKGNFCHFFVHEAWPFPVNWNLRQACNETWYFSQNIPKAFSRIVLTFSVQSVTCRGRPMVVSKLPSHIATPISSAAAMTRRSTHTSGKLRIRISHFTRFHPQVHRFASSIIKKTQTFSSAVSLTDNVAPGTLELVLAQFQAHHAKSATGKASTQFCGSTAKPELNFSPVVPMGKSYGGTPESSTRFVIKL